MTNPIPNHQMQPPSSDDFLNGKSVKSFSFDVEPPARLGGQITELPPVIQKRDFDTGDLLYWNDGRPKWVMPVYCQTDARDDQDDDGVRAHYLEYKKANAVKAALKAAGVERLEVGGTLWLTYLPPKPARGAAKNYSAEYTPPPPGFVDPKTQEAAWNAVAPGGQTDPWAVGQQPPSQQQYAPPQQAYQPPPQQQAWPQPAAASAAPAPAPAGPAPAAGIDPQTAAFLASKGIDPSKITDPNQLQMILNTFPDAPRS